MHVVCFLTLCVHYVFFAVLCSLSKCHLLGFFSSLFLSLFFFGDVFLFFYWCEFCLHCDACVEQISRRLDSLHPGPMLLSLCAPFVCLCVLFRVCVDIVPDSALVSPEVF